MSSRASPGQLAGTGEGPAREMGPLDILGGLLTGLAGPALCRGGNSASFVSQVRAAEDNSAFLSRQAGALVEEEDERPCAALLMVSAGETHCCSRSSQAYAGAMSQAGPILSSLSLSKPCQPWAQVPGGWN